jgi:Domain of unknown function (DUF4145)
MINRRLCTTKVPWFHPWPCPACKQGTIQSLKEGESPIRHWPNTGVAAGIDEGFIERSDDYGVFSATLRCSNYQCQQGIAVVGDYSTSLSGMGMWETERSYEILDIHPAILLIDIPEATPKPIKTSLSSSFPLYWRDPQACAGKLRTAVEDVLEHLGQPRKVRGKFISLAVRLKNLKALHPELAESADILRDLGNAGAHGDQVDRDQLLDSYELFEIELRELFTDDATRRRALITKLRPPAPAAPPKP